MLICSHSAATLASTFIRRNRMNCMVRLPYPRFDIHGVRSSPNPANTIKQKKSSRSGAHRCYVRRQESIKPASAASPMKTSGVRTRPIPSSVRPRRAGLALDAYHLAVQRPLEGTAIVGFGTSEAPARPMARPIQGHRRQRLSHVTSAYDRGNRIHQKRYHKRKSS